MCNSWNHTFECTCGFGGEGHLGGGGHGGFPQNFSFAHFRVHYDRYVVPNARCPVCREYVFFYQSPFGGRVFFDELGIPWPKHRCTNSGSAMIETIDVEMLRKSGFTRERKWEAEGWRPFTVWHFTGEKLFGTYSDYVNKINESTSSYFGKPRTSYRLAEDVPLIALRLPEGRNWLERKRCIFSIYPTFIRGSKRGDQFFELSTFVLRAGGAVHAITVTDAYMPRLNIGEKITVGSLFKFERKTGTLVPDVRPYV